MLSYIGRRLVSGVITIWFIATATFIGMHAVPGDPLLNDKAVTPEIRAKSHRSTPNHCHGARRYSNGGIPLTLTSKKMIINGLMMARYLAPVHTTQLAIVTPIQNNISPK